ncbi:hypothetical protein, partial [Streptococcus pneumoniae]|uniref:hypothetical protein n=1 Tax=Streptococcus pneumoniae TaxID=1313 RepID=UPI001953C1E6
VILTPTIEANCSTGKFTTLAGSGYQFIGSNPRFDPTDSSENPAFLIAPVDEKEPLKDYANTGYVTVLEQFKALCPGRLR